MDELQPEGIQGPTGGLFFSHWRRLEVSFPTEADGSMVIGSTMGTQNLHF